VSRKEASRGDDTVQRAKCGTSVHAFACRFFGASISQALLGELIQAWIDTGAQCP
jgi:hypothetical protein